MSQRLKAANYFMKEGGWPQDVAMQYIRYMEVKLEVELFEKFLNNEEIGMFQMATVVYHTMRFRKKTGF